MNTADMIAERAARAIADTHPHGISGNIFTGNYSLLVANIKSQMLNLAKDLGVLEVKG